MIPAAELQAIRAEAAQYLVQRATIRRRNIATDGRGGQIEDWYDLAANVPYRRDSGSGGETRVGERQTPTQTWRAKFAWGQDLKETDRIVDESTLETFDVTYIEQRPFDAYRQADLARL